jgi:hypothetical protein
MGGRRDQWLFWTVGMRNFDQISLLVENLTNQMAFMHALVLVLLHQHSKTGEKTTAI